MAREQGRAGRPNPWTNGEVEIMVAHRLPFRLDALRVFIWHALIGHGARIGLHLIETRRVQVVEPLKIIVGEAQVVLVLRHRVHQRILRAGFGRRLRDTAEMRPRYGRDGAAIC